MAYRLKASSCNPLTVTGFLDGRKRGQSTLYRIKRWSEATAVIIKHEAAIRRQVIMLFDVENAIYHMTNSMHSALDTKTIVKYSVSWLLRI